MVAGQPGLGERPGEKGGELTGPNPTDRGKAGSKYHLLVDAHGLPLNVLVSGANRHDSLFVEPILDSMPAVRIGGRGHPRRWSDDPPEECTPARTAVPGPVVVGGTAGRFALRTTAWLTARTWSTCIFATRRS